MCAMIEKCAFPHYFNAAALVLLGAALTGLGVIFVVVDIDFIIGLEVAVFVEEEEEAEDSGTTDTDVTDRFGEVRKEGDEESFGVTDGEEEEESRLLSECPLFPHTKRLTRGFLFPPSTVVDDADLSIAAVSLVGDEEMDSNLALRFFAISREGV